jgi:membrane complex biogenesis BtpA family protein
VKKFCDLFTSPKPIIGVVHLPPLPGFEGHPGLDALVEHALADLAVLITEGVDGVLIENEYDRPHEVMATPAVTAAMKEIVGAVVAEGGSIVTGCEVLLNDPRASLDVAAFAGAQFIRSDYFVDRMSRPGYGEFQIDPDGLVEYRDSMAPGVLILADVQVKYATMLEQRSLRESAHLAARHRADAIVVTGDETGDAPRIDHLDDATSAVAGKLPVLIGSGLDPSNAGRLLRACDGAIVGTSLLRSGKICAERTLALMQKVRELPKR